MRLGIVYIAKEVFPCLSQTPVLFSGEQFPIDYQEVLDKDVFPYSFRISCAHVDSVSFTQQ